MRVPYTEPVPDWPKKQRTRGPYLAERLRPKPVPKPDNGKGSGNGRSRRVPQKEALDPMPVQPPAQQESPAPPAPGNGNGNGPKLPRGVAEAVINSGLNPILPTPEAIITEVAKIAFFDARKLPGLEDLDEDVAAAVSSYTKTPLTYEGKPILGPDGQVLYKIHYTIASKTAAHDQLNRWAGNYKKDNDQSKLEFNQYNQYNRVDLSGYTEEELMVLLKAGMAIRGEAGREYLELPPAGNSDPGQDG